MGTGRGWEGGRRKPSPGPLSALAEDWSQPVSRAWKREEHILMQRCCSGSGRAHTQAPSPATATAATAAPGQQRAAEGAGRRGGRPEGPAVPGSPPLASGSVHLPQPAPSFTPGRCQQLLSPPSQGLPGCCYGKGLRAHCLCNLGGAGTGWEPQPVGRTSDFSAQEHGGHWNWRCPTPCLRGWHPAGPWQAEPGQEAGPQQCVQEFKSDTS